MVSVVEKTIPMLQKTIKRFEKGEDFAGDAGKLLDALISETDESAIAALLSAWNTKGIAESEIYAVARVMRERMTPVNSLHETFVDIVGTGGSKTKLFNVSTAAAFVVAGAGIAVAKHGNRAATSNAGSADVLSALGVAYSVDAATAERCLNEIGVCFMFAPNFHRLSPALGKARRSLGEPTIFNCVGPLANPASAPHSLIGVWDAALVPKMANALARLGTKRSWIVHGSDGLDEITLSGKTVAAEVFDGSFREFTIAPRDFGVSPQPIESCRVRSADESAAVVNAVLASGMKNSPAENVVLINAAAAIHIAGRANGLAEAYNLAEESIRSGRAREKLAELREALG